MVFSQKQLNGLADEILRMVKTYSERSSGIFSCIKHISCEQFYSIDMADFLSCVSTCINKTTFYEVIPERFPNLSTAIADRRFFRAFIRYYYVRLPFLFVVKYKPLGLPSFDEFEFVAKRVGVGLEKSYPEDFKKLPKNMFDELAENYRLQAARFKILSKKVANIDDIVYDFSNLWEDCSSVDNWLNKECNGRKFTLYFFESCFSMFWDVLQDEYLRAVRYLPLVK